MEIMHRRLVVPPLFDLTPLHHILHEICEGEGGRKGNYTIEAVSTGNYYIEPYHFSKRSAASDNHNMSCGLTDIQHSSIHVDTAYTNGKSCVANNLTVVFQVRDLTM